MKYYLIKYVLSSNGHIATAEHYKESDDGTRLYGPHFSSYTVGKDAFVSEQQAITAASAMRDKKIASLKKQIAKLEKMQFKVVAP